MPGRNRMEDRSAISVRHGEKKMPAGTLRRIPLPGNFTLGWKLHTQRVDLIELGH